MLASAIVAPAVGAFEERSNTGTTGFATFTDFNGNPGVKCKYENNPLKKHDEIDKIKIANHWSHGPYENKKTWVGSRFKIFKDAKPFDGQYKQVFASSIIKDKGDENDTVAFFDQRKWKAPEKSKARYRVRQILFFYAKGSKKNVIGKIKGEYELYQHNLPGGPPPYVIGNEGGDNGYCNHKYWAIVP
jgi:hypothetical protein